MTTSQQHSGITQYKLTEPWGIGYSYKIIIKLHLKSLCTREKETNENFLLLAMT